eukprot:jgi/Ulvmu1/1551/UM110_0014.1
MMDPQYLKFVPLQLKVPVNVWSWLGQHKLDHLKLDEGPCQVNALLVPAAYHRGSGEDSAVELLAGMQTSRSKGDSIAATAGIDQITFCTTFMLNQKENLSDSNICNKMLAEAGHTLRSSISSASAFEDPDVLFHGLLLLHADLKRHVYSHCAAFPYLKLPQACAIVKCQSVAAALPDAAQAAIQALSQQAQWPALVSLDTDTPSKPKVTPFSDLARALQEGGASPQWPQGLIVATLDTSSHAGILGGATRNLLALLAQHFPAATVQVLALRAAHGALSPEHSQLLELKLPEGMNADSAPLLGWESSRPHPEEAGVRVPVVKVAQLAEVLDTGAQATQALALNLKLMRWRAAPALDLDAIAAMHCLILGCGTLGCEVARTLVAWGVQKLTLVDNGTVAFSNPARQSLFTVEDCKGGGGRKAFVAAEALRRCAASLQVQPVSLTIPMPGHPPVSTEVQQTIEDVTQLDELVREADAVFLLTDSRESRWLPSLLAATHDKLLLNAALGFDSWVAMRHGVRAARATDAAEADEDTSNVASTSAAASCGKREAAEGAQRLGCYFCNDVVAPANSLAGRSMDEQCTVVRPGLARIAAATAVEMFAALTQHEDGAAAPAAEGGSGGVLGGVPHMLRGTLMGFGQSHMTGQANPVCSACCDSVVAAYSQRGPVLCSRCSRTITSLRWLAASTRCARTALRPAAQQGEASTTMRTRTGRRCDHVSAACVPTMHVGCWQLLDCNSRC